MCKKILWLKFYRFNIGIVQTDKVYMRFFKKINIFLTLVSLIFLNFIFVMASQNNKMLIFVSPEYSESEEVKNAIQRYTEAVQMRGPNLKASFMYILLMK
ncbi:MAG TPA: hypothetical protein VJB34_07970 [Bdellovibrionota bacterium]|nr:hypothetical protein [Bdellovibrionota bacterium]